MFREIHFDFVKGCLMLFLPCKLFHIFQLHKVREFLGFTCQIRDKFLNNLIDLRTFEVLSCFVEHWLKH